MPETIEGRRRRVEAVAEGMGSQKALADALEMSEPRISKALNKELASDRRLAPIERAISEKKLWQYAERQDYPLAPDVGDGAATFPAPPQANQGKASQDVEPLASHRTIEQYDEEGNLLWAVEVRFLAGRTRKYFQRVS